MDDEFYIGYEPMMPARLAARITTVAVALLVLALGLAAILSVAQSPSVVATFEYGRPRIFEGRIVEFPYPALVSQTTGGARRWYWLVGPGKHGAAAIARRLDGRRVRLTGSLIAREGEQMIEVDPNTIVEMGQVREEEAAAPVEILGARTFEGEVVDSKCHLGVMKPGEGPTHRDCAVRCLLGDIPPMLALHGPFEPGRLALVSTSHQPLTAAWAAIAGRPVRVTGVLLRRGGQYFLSVTPSEVVVVEPRRLLERPPAPLARLAQILDD